MFLRRDGLSTREEAHALDAAYFEHIYAVPSFETIHHAYAVYCTSLPTEMPGAGDRHAIPSPRKRDAVTQSVHRPRAFRAICVIINDVRIEIQRVSKVLYESTHAIKVVKAKPSRVLNHMCEQYIEGARETFFCFS